MCFVCNFLYFYLFFLSNQAVSLGSRHERKRIKRSLGFQSDGGGGEEDSEMFVSGCVDNVLALLSSSSSSPSRKEKEGGEKAREDVGVRLRALGLLLDPNLLKLLGSRLVESTVSKRIVELATSDDDVRVRRCVSCSWTTSSPSPPPALFFFDEPLWTHLFGGIYF